MSTVAEQGVFIASMYIDHWGSKGLLGGGSVVDNDSEKEDQVLGGCHKQSWIVSLIQYNGMA
jgi:hypothetical protein